MLKNKPLAGLALCGTLILNTMMSLPVYAKTGFEASAYTILGVEYRDAFYDRDGETAETVPMLRRLKLGLDYRPTDRWRAEVGYQYSLVGGEDGPEEDMGFVDAYIRYSWPGKHRAYLGRIKEPFGFERLTGTSKQTGTERSIMSSGLAPGRSYGLMFSRERKRLSWALGLFQESQADDTGRAITGRITYAPIRGDNDTLHLGLAASFRDLNRQDFQIRERAEIHEGGTIARSARYRAEKARLLGTELVWQSGALTLASEFMAQETEQVNGTTWLYSGYYGQASYFLTGEQRRYKPDGFRDVKPLNPGGAWELAGRISQLSLRDNQLGSRTRVGLIGLNYYLNKGVIVKLQALHAEISGNTLHSGTSGNAVVLRLQTDLF